jgi:hypothetical protein
MGNNYSAAELRRRQEARVEQLSLNLKTITLRFVEDDVEGFEVSSRCKLILLGGTIGTVLRLVLLLARTLQLFLWHGLLA